MNILQLSRHGKARVWFRRETADLVPSGIIRETVPSQPAGTVRAATLALEVYVPRGGRADYGLLGFSFTPDHHDALEIGVPFTEAAGVSWSDALANGVDDVRLGLPKEYAVAVLGGAATFATSRLPSGSIAAVEAAHGLIGSSPDFFRRIAVAALTLMVEEHNGDEEKMKSLVLGPLLA